MLVEAIALGTVPQDVLAPRYVRLQGTKRVRASVGQAAHGGDAQPGMDARLVECSDRERLTQRLEEQGRRVLPLRDGLHRKVERSVHGGHVRPGIDAIA